MQREPGDQLLVRDDVVLAVIDVQEKLLPVINDREKMLDNIVKLLRFAKVVGLPVLLTEQENLGPTVARIREELGDLAPITKIEFDACKRPQFVQRLEELGRHSILVTGIEAHICIAQTVLHLLPRFRVHVIGDAVASRVPENRHIALERMRQSGAVVSSTEMAMYELLERAGTDEFRQILPLVK
jgi:isochorismate hydrolase